MKDTAQWLDDNNYREHLDRTKYYPAEGKPANKYRAIYTGEKRPPKKGEYYLSGSRIMAYQAPNDLSTPYHIARLCEVKITTTISEVIKEIST